jgi:hypothetical protein
VTTSYPPAPPITLTAEGSGRELRFDRPGTTTLLICMTQESQQAAEAIEEAARARWPLASDLLIAYVIDLRSVPGLFRKVAENILASEYSKAVEALNTDQVPEDYVVLLPDWQGEAIQALGFDGGTHAPGVAVLTSHGGVVGKLGSAAAEDAAALIEQALRA